MQAFFQHVGASNAQRDYPKSLFSDSGPIEFDYAYLAGHLTHLPDDERNQIELDLNRCGGRASVWGLPAGAKSVVSKMSRGDVVLLVGLAAQGGGVSYASELISSPIMHANSLSKKIWGEDRFPSIILLQGAPAFLDWEDFLLEFGYAPNWRPAGQTYRITPERLEKSRFENAEGLRASLLTENKYGCIDETYPFEFFEEGSPVLRAHLVRERSGRLIRAFKKNLENYRCEVCGFDFASKYGEIGRGYIEAHHDVSLSAADDVRLSSVDDLVAVCANCHRMLHRRYPALTVADLRAHLSKA